MGLGLTKCVDQDDWVHMQAQFRWWHWKTVVPVQLASVVRTTEVKKQDQ